MTVLRSMYFENDEDNALRKMSFTSNYTKSDIVRLALRKSMEEWIADPKLLNADMAREMKVISDPPSLPVPDTGQLMKNWRGRRLLACQAVSELAAIIENLTHDDGTTPPPTDSTASIPSEDVKREMTNMATALLRMILLHNDGRVSPQTLPRF